MSDFSFIPAGLWEADDVRQGPGIETFMRPVGAFSSRARRCALIAADMGLTTI
jgi:hypothetical protein